MNPQGQPDHQQPNFYDGDEITLREIILKIIYFSKEVWKNKFLILLFGLLMAIAFYTFSATRTNTYTSFISFLLIGENTNSIVVYSPYGDMEVGTMENNKIKEIAMSNTIMYKVLLTDSDINGKNDKLANHIIDIYGLNKIWNKEKLSEKKKSLSLKDYRVVANNTSEFSGKDYRAMVELQNIIVGNELNSKKGLATFNYDEKSDIFNLEVESINGEISERICTEVYNELSQFYLKEAMGRPQEAFEIMSLEADSLLLELNKTEQKLAYAKDRNRGITLSINDFRMSKLETEVNKLNSRYNAYIESLQKLEYSLQRDPAEFKVINQTFFPTRNAPSKKMSTLIGAFLGVLSGIIFVILRDMIKRALNENNISEKASHNS